MSKFVQGRPRGERRLLQEQRDRLYRQSLPAEAAVQQCATHNGQSHAQAASECAKTSPTC